MLLVLSSANDPELPLLSSRTDVAVVVAPHLSQSGWTYEVGKGACSRMVTSRGTISASDVSGVLTRTQRVMPTELPHIHEEDRDYVASEMTAFLAAVINELDCPLLNRPAANSLWGPPWMTEHWLRLAAEEGFPVCCNRDRRCSASTAVVVLGRNAVHFDDGVPKDAVPLSLMLAQRADVNLLEAKFCLSHQALQKVWLRPALNQKLISEIEQYCVNGQ